MTGILCHRLLCPLWINRRLSIEDRNNGIEGPSRLKEVFSIWTAMIIHLLTAVVNAEVIVPVCEPYDSLYHT